MYGASPPYPGPSSSFTSTNIGHGTSNIWMTFGSLFTFAHSPERIRSMNFTECRLPSLRILPPEPLMMRLKRGGMSRSITMVPISASAVFVGLVLPGLIWLMTILCPGIMDRSWGQLLTYSDRLALQPWYVGQYRMSNEMLTAGHI